MVQLVTLQQVLWQRGQSSLQVAQGEALQWWPTVSQAGPRQSGDTTRFGLIDVSIKFTGFHFDFKLFGFDYVCVYLCLHTFTYMFIEDGWMEDVLFQDN